MAQTCSREATIRQSFLNDYKGELPLEFPKNLVKTNPYMNILFFYASSNRKSFIYTLSDSARDKLSLLNLKRIEDLSKNLDEYDGSFIEI